MTIYSDLSRVRYVGNGVTTQFAVPFKFFSNKDGSSQLSVYIGDSDIPLEENKDYKINGAGQEEGGEVIFLETPQAGMQIAIIRNVPKTQEYVFKNEDKFPAAVYENAIDKLTMEVQEVKENLNRALVLPPTSKKKPLEVRNEILEAREEAANSASAALASAEQAQEAADNATQAVQSVETMLEEAEADISQTVSQAQTTIQGYVDNVEEEVVQIATSTAQAAVADAAEEATQIALTNIQPLVDSASSSATAAEQSETNAAASAGSASQSAQSAQEILADVVHKTGNETISGVKTFIENIITNGVIPTTDRSNKAATTQWIYDNVACKVGTYSYQFAGSSTQDVILKIGYGQATSSGQQNYFSSSFPNSCHGVLITMTYGLESSIKNDLWYTDLTASGFVAHKVDTVNFFYIAIGY